MIRLCIYYPDPEIRWGGGGGSRSHRKLSSALRASVWSKDHGGGRAPGSLPWIPHCFLSYLKPTASIRKERPWCCMFSQTLKKLNFNAPINIMPAGRGGRGMGWEFDCRCWPWDRAFDWSCSPRGGDIWIFLRLTWRLTTRTKKTETEHMFPTSTLHAYGLESSGDHGGQREQVKAGWISLFCLQISYHVF